MSKNNLIVAALALVVAGMGFYIYQDQQKETVSISIGSKELSIETD